MVEPNKRRHRRYDVDGVQGSLAFQIEAKILNMSLTGMAIETASMLKVGANYRLQVPYESDVLDLPADVKWCHLVRTELSAHRDVVPVYHAGIDFRSVLDQKAQEVLSFIENHIIVDLEQRLFGRFELTDSDEVEVTAERSFNVKRISLSGMLIDTEIRPQDGEVMQFEIHPNGSPIEVEGRIVSVKALRSGKEPVIEVGVEFLELADVHRKRLQKFVEGLIE